MRTPTIRFQITTLLLAFKLFIALVFFSLTLTTEAILTYLSLTSPPAFFLRAKKIFALFLLFSALWYLHLDTQPYSALIPTLVLTLSLFLQLLSLKKPRLPLWLNSRPSIISKIFPLTLTAFIASLLTLLGLPSADQLGTSILACTYLYSLHSTR